MLARADALGQRYGCRPSSLLGIDVAAQPLAAWQVDEAAALAGILSAPRPPAPAAPGAAPRVRMLGGSPLVTGVIEREDGAATA